MGKSAKAVAVVAGGAGFIGSHLCRALLDRHYRVVCIDNLQTSRLVNLEHLMRDDGFTFTEADITDPLPLRPRDLEGPITRIFNLACAASPPQYQTDPEHTMLTNVVGTDRLLRLAEETGARFLLTSTSEVYGDPEVHPQQEDYRGWVNCTGPRACYDEGKRAAEALCFDFARTQRADVRVARIFNTYGPHMNPDDGRVISNLICQALAGPEITIYGSGQQTRSFCYVTDMVRGLMCLMDADTAPQPVNLGNPQECSIGTLAGHVIELIGSSFPVVHRPLPVDDPRRRRPDIARARDLLGWKPATPLLAGLRETVRWFSAELERKARVDFPAGTSSALFAGAARH